MATGICVKCRVLSGPLELLSSCGPRCRPRRRLVRSCRTWSAAFLTGKVYPISIGRPNAGAWARPCQRTPVVAAPGLTNDRLRRGCSCELRRVANMVIPHFGRVPPPVRRTPSRRPARR